MSYTIEVTREISKGTGTLTYKHGAVSINTTCWFELAKPIPAKKYIRCSATHMQTKKNSKGQKREGIYLPDNQTNRGGVFIHMGANSSWSEGCIVIKEAEILKIWNSINPKDGENVTVIVKNK